MLLWFFILIFFLKTLASNWLQHVLFSSASLLLIIKDELVYRYNGNQNAFWRTILFKYLLILHAISTNTLAIILTKNILGSIIGLNNTNTLSRITKQWYYECEYRIYVNRRYNIDFDYYAMCALKDYFNWSFIWIIVCSFIFNCYSEIFQN